MADSDASSEGSVESSDQEVVMTEAEPTPLSPEAMNPLQIRVLHPIKRQPPPIDPST